MDMSVKVGAGGGEEKRHAAGTAANIDIGSGLEAWLAKVEAMGELKRITAEVDPDLERPRSRTWWAWKKAPRCCSKTSRAIRGTGRSTT